VRANIVAMLNYPLVRFLLFWGVNTLSLWVADDVFEAISFATPQSLFIAGLMLGVMNAFLKPLLVILTLPLSIITFGLFVLIINAMNHQCNDAAAGSVAGTRFRRRRILVRIYGCDFRVGFQFHPEFHDWLQQDQDSTHAIRR